jgi:hypothetical protein
LTAARVYRVLSFSTRKKYRTSAKREAPWKLS